jgi:hypothetical protein
MEDDIVDTADDSVYLGGPDASVVKSAKRCVRGESQRRSSGTTTELRGSDADDGATGTRATATLYGPHGDGLPKGD